MGGRQTIWRTGWRKTVDGLFFVTSGRTELERVITLLCLIAFELRQIFLHHRDILGIGGDFQIFPQLSGCIGTIALCDVDLCEQEVNPWIGVIAIDRGSLQGTFFRFE